MATGERPADGSSSNNKVGLVINALAKAKICLCPPERFPALSFYLSLSNENCS